jgi:hypothetical protein
MKLLAKIVLFGIIVFPVILFCRPNPRTPPPAAATDPAAPADSSASAQPSSYGAKAASAFRHTLGQLRWKLHEWQASIVNDPDNVAEHDRLLREMLALVTDDNVATVVQSLSAADLDTPLGIGALHHWMHLDQVQATAWLAARPETTAGQTLAVADDWVAHRAGLQEFLGQLPATAWKQNFISDLGAEMSVKDPAAAVKLAAQMDASSAQLDLFRTVACNWVATDHDAAFQWVAGITNAPLRDQLIVSSVQAYAVTDPASAVNWLVESVNSDDTVNTAALNILRTWAAQNPAQAAQWVSQFPDGNLKAAAVQIVSGYWLQTDRDAASAWVQNLPVTPTVPAD